MLNRCTPSSGSIRRIRRVLCLNHFLGKHVCQDRICAFRHDDSNEKALLGVFQWFPYLEADSYMDHMNDFQGRVFFVNLCYHPKILEHSGDSTESDLRPAQPQLILDKAP